VLGPSLASEWERLLAEVPCLPCIRFPAPSHSAPRCPMQQGASKGELLCRDADAVQRDVAVCQQRCHSLSLSPSLPLSLSSSLPLSLSLRLGVWVCVCVCVCGVGADASFVDQIKERVGPKTLLGKAVRAVAQE
jgi:hypothetical protein